MSVLICEPQCFGFEHAAFNAALLVTVANAFPEDDLCFKGEASHLNEIESILKAVPASGTEPAPLSTVRSAICSRVLWQPTPIPERHLGGLRRLSSERVFVRAAIAHAQSTSARCIIFCSATEITILALKQQLRKQRIDCQICVVLHGVLRSLVEPRWRKPWRWGFSLRQALRLPTPSNLSYIVLSESIRQHAIQAEPHLKHLLHSIDMPRLWQPDITLQNNDTQKVRFGFFGSTAKGFAAFYEVASVLKSRHAATDFSLIGFLNGRDLERNYGQEIVAGLSREPLSQQEYSQRASHIHYAVWLANPLHYSLTASASFLDALDFAKPIVYLANPYIDAYVKEMGDIGYRCETLAEVQNTIGEIAMSFPKECYLQQQRTILEGRKRFDPAVIAPHLKRILETDQLSHAHFNA